MATSVTTGRDPGEGWRPTVVSIEGRFLSASNATFLGSTDEGDLAVYKPIAGEQPLWDFPAETLASREVLTFELSEAMDLGVVPRTVIGEGPFGPGSIQRYVDIDESFDPLDLVRTRPETLWPIALLDLVANNADRKLGHILRGRDGRLVAIDHGLTFHIDEKLRTVLWVLDGQAIPTVLMGSLGAAATALAGDLGDRVAALLGGDARRAAARRVAAVQRHPVHPAPPDHRPAVPWPPY